MPPYLAADAAPGYADGGYVGYSLFGLVEVDDIDVVVNGREAT